MELSQIMKSLYSNQVAWYIDMFGKIKSNKTTLYADRNNCSSEKHINKWLAINDLINVSLYFNQSWQPSWDNENEKKYFIICENIYEKIFNVSFCTLQAENFIFFKNKEFAEKAIDIIGKKKLLEIFTN